MTFIPIFFIFNYLNKSLKSTDISNNNKIEIKVKDDPFIISFRKTQIESMIVSKVEEISKSRDIQFVFSSFYYKDDKSINGSMYVATSKIIYKIIFIKMNLVCKELYTFKSFVSPTNRYIYNTITNNFKTNTNWTKQKHHNEFYTWPHYYLTDNYKIESSNLEKFFRDI